MAEVVAALVRFAWQVVEHDHIRPQHQKAFQRNVAAVTRRPSRRRLEPGLLQQRGRKAALARRVAAPID